MLGVVVIGSIVLSFHRVSGFRRQVKSRGSECASGRRVLFSFDETPLGDTVRGDIGAVKEYPLSGPSSSWSVGGGLLLSRGGDHSTASGSSVGIVGLTRDGGQIGVCL